MSEFNSRNLNLDKKIDLIVSAYTFRHLIDSLGIFLQAYSLLDPETGIMLADGFRFAHSGLHELLINDLEWHKANIYWLLTQLSSSFLIWMPNKGKNFLPEFIIRKSNGEVAELPLSYENIKIANHSFSHGSTSIISMFNSHTSILIPTLSFKRNYYLGNEELYDSLTTKNLFNTLKYKCFSPKYRGEAPQDINQPILFNDPQLILQESICNRLNWAVKNQEMTIIKQICEFKGNSQPNEDTLSKALETALDTNYKKGINFLTNLSMEYELNFSTVSKSLFWYLHHGEIKQEDLSGFLENQIENENMVWIKCLIQLSGEIKLSQKDKNKALIWAAGMGRPDLVEFILKSEEKWESAVILQAELKAKAMNQEKMVTWFTRFSQANARFFSKVMANSSDEFLSSANPSELHDDSLVLEPSVG